MTREEIKFLIDNRINFESVKLGFTRNIPFDILAKYEDIYRKYLDVQYVLTYWCGGCVFEMMNRLIMFCEQDENFINAWNGDEIKQSEEVEKKKRGRPKK